MSRPDDLAALDPLDPRRRSVASPHWTRVALAEFAHALPALLAAMVLVRMVELVLGRPGGTEPMAMALTVGFALLDDVLAIIRWLPGLFLLSLPVLRLRARLRLPALGLLWSLLLLAQVALSQYFLTARVPLGADLLGYSWDELHQTVATGGSFRLSTLLAVLLPLGTLWAVLWWRRDRPLPDPGGRWSVVALLLALVAFVLVSMLHARVRLPTESLHNLAINKMAWFTGDVLRWWLPENDDGLSDSVGEPREFRYLDAAYPFLRAERTPDVLGASMAPSETRPNLVFIVVEGLGRSFSGPGARLGSFTPFLDELAASGLSFQHAIAPQGRTFGVLPSLLGSLPFGEQGFTQAGAGMPRHHSLPSLLHGQGWRVLFHGGFDLSFDHTGTFMALQGADVRVGLHNFGPGYTRQSDALSWGYPDGEVFARALADLRRERGPFVSVIQTMSMHTPYRVPDHATWRARVEQRLQTLGVPPDQRAPWREYADIYASILYTDDALRRFFEQFQREPAYADTLFVITGDHRLPEIPMDTRIERYHVPLLIVGPRLRQPRRVAAVNSHFDVAPSLLAWLAHKHGLRTPAAVTWLGSGLDLSPVFRNRHDIPIKQTKTLLDDYVSGRWYYSQKQLYAIGPGLQIEPAHDTAAQLRLKRRLARFKHANRQLADDGRLMPDNAPVLLAWDDTSRDTPPTDVADGVAVVVAGVRVPEHAEPGGLVIEIDLANRGTRDASAFVPLAVLMDEQGRELSESYGRALTLAAGASASVLLPVKSLLPPGRYYLSVMPSHPDTGRRVGEGRYRLPVELRALSSAPPPTSEPP